MKAISILAGLILCSSLLLADDQHIDFDEKVDFSSLKTFAIRDAKINSQKPEFNNRLFVQKIGEAIRLELTAKGLKETADRPDILVNFSLSGKDYSTVERHPGTRVPDTPGHRGYVVEGTGPTSVLSSEGTLVIDLIANASGGLIWRGTYRDEESSPPRLARKLPIDAKKLLSEFPPKKKR
jgi:hypothetical protein